MKKTVLIALVFATSLSYAQESSRQTPGERIDALVKATGIDEAAGKPLHLKWEMTLFDNKGINPQTGTVEMWRSGGDQRIIYNFGSVKSTELKSAGKFYRSGDGAPTYFVKAVIDNTLHPGPTAEDLDHAKPELQQKSLGGAPFECIVLAHVFDDGAVAPFGFFPTFCMERGPNDLRVSYGVEGQMVVFNTIAIYLARQVPSSMTISVGLTVVAKAKLIALGTFTPTSADFTPAPSDISSASDISFVSGDLNKGTLVTRVLPKYPISARIGHISGTVIIHAIISKNGHIRSLRAKTYPDPDLVIAALTAVRQWTYKPYLVNGQPTDVDTTITVDFNTNEQTMTGRQR